LILSQIFEYIPFKSGSHFITQKHQYYFRLFLSQNLYRQGDNYDFSKTLSKSGKLAGKTKFSPFLPIATSWLKKGARIMKKNVLFSALILLFVYSCSDGLTDSDKELGDLKDPGAIRIGLINDNNDTTTPQRLQSLAANTKMLNELGISEFTITEITSAIDPDSLKEFTIIYLPVSWAALTTPIYENINDNAAQYMNYVKSGGSMFIEQPNPFNRPGNTITIDFLPYPVTLSNGYLDEEVTVVDSTHYITTGLDGIDLPFPGDQVQDLPEQYTLLAEGTSSGYPSLFTLNHDDGKILFAMGHPSSTSVHPYSDAAYYKMLNWLTLAD